MSSAIPPALLALARDPARSAVLLDFDGTLAEIVARPELARPVDGAVGAIGELVERFAVVAVISGRPTEDVRSLLGVEGVRYLGLYGLEESVSEPVPASVLEAARAAADAVPRAHVEGKGGSVAVHYRQAPDPATARAAILGALADPPEGFEVIEGKMVIELVPAGRPRKDGAVRRVLQDSGPAAALYAGDDLADLEAFAELTRFAASAGIHAVRVAVRGPETPDQLTSGADVRVDGPAGMVRLLADLAELARAPG